MKGSIHRKDENKYQLVYDLPPNLEGQRRQKKLIFNGTKKLAEAELAKRLDAIRKSEYTTEGGWTFNDLIDRYLKIAKNELAATTYQRYAGIIRSHIRPLLGKIRLDRLTALHLEDAKTQWLQAGNLRTGAALTERTVLGHHRLIRRILHRGVKWRLVAFNVADSVEAPKPPRTEMTALTEAQLVKLLDAAQLPPPQNGKSQCFGISSESSFYAAIIVLAYTGARRGEALALKWDDLDFAARTVTIRRSLQQTHDGLAFKGTKNGRPRIVSMHDDAFGVLKRHRAEQNKDRLVLGKAYQDHGLVFARADGSTINPHAFGDAFRALVKRTDVPRIRLHDLRHTHVSLLLKDGASLKVASERAGHSTISVTADVYAHVLPGMDRQAADGFGSLLRNVSAKRPRSSVTFP